MGTMGENRERRNKIGNIQVVGNWCRNVRDIYNRHTNQMGNKSSRSDISRRKYYPVSDKQQTGRPVHLIGG